MSLAGVGYSAALCLAVLFVLAAVGKVRDPQGTIDSFRALGVPAAAPVGRLLPVLELVTVVLLVVLPALGGLVALVMLVFFTTFLVLRLRAGVLAPCNCVAALGEGPLSWLAVVRNACFMALAVLAMTSSGPTRPTVADALAVAGLTVAALAGIVIAGNRRSRFASR